MNGNCLWPKTSVVVDWWINRWYEEICQKILKVSRLNSSIKMEALPEGCCHAVGGHWKIESTYKRFVKACEGSGGWMEMGWNGSAVPLYSMPDGYPGISSNRRHFPVMLSHSGQSPTTDRQTDKALIWPGEDGPSLPCYLLWAPENAINFPSYRESSGNGTELMDLSGIGLCSHSGNESYSVERSMCNTEKARASLPPYHRLSNRPWKLDWTRVIISN